MSRWFIGCGVVLVIVIGILTAGGFFIAGQVKELTQAADQAGDLLAHVEEAYPFAVPSDRLLDPQRFEAYLQAREQLADFVSDSAETTDKGTILKRVQSGVGAFQSAMPRFAETLEEVGMSAKEYAWISQQINYVTQYSLRDEVRTEFPQLPDLYARRVDPYQGRDDGPGIEGVRFGQSDQAGSGWAVVSSIDPYHLTVPLHNVEIVAKNTQRLVDSIGAVHFEPFVLPMYLDRWNAD